jgi:hypothetical protein
MWACAAVLKNDGDHPFAEAQLLGRNSGKPGLSNGIIDALVLLVWPYHTAAPAGTSARTDRAKLQQIPAP